MLTRARAAQRARLGGADVRVQLLDLGEDLLGECVPSPLILSDLASISKTCAALREVRACLE